MGKTNLRELRLGAINKNSIGDLMKVVEYVNSNNITVQFLDNFKSLVNTSWTYFEKGYVTNPYGKYVSGIGILGNNNIKDNNGKLLKEYRTWVNMLNRCYNNSGSLRDERYIDCYISEEWIYYDNFYHWVHSQENYNSWIKLDHSSIDKDILFKGNKIYSPDRCCLVPSYINSLFTKHNKKRGEYYIGVSFHKRDKVFTATCNNPFTQKSEHLGYYDTELEAFNAYKKCKESFIKQIAEKEYKNGNITKQCYKAMINYEVKTTD